MDWPCQVPKGQLMFCTCHFPTRPYLLLRGLCRDSNIDRMYLPQNDPVHGDLTIYGLEDTTIQVKDKQWTLSVTPENTSASTEAVTTSFVLGKHTWRVEGDSYDCDKGQPYTTTLKLTGCREEEFTCSDGQCVPMSQRCDQLEQCRDQSDEEDCQLLVLKRSYNRKVPPITTITSTQFNPVTVDISIVLLKIVSIEEVNHKVEFQFGICLEWKENRALYHNLKTKTSLNALTDEEIVLLWLPYVIYDNTDMKEAVQLQEGVVKTTLTVTREGNFTRSGEEVAEEIEIFQGNQNKLTMRQTYSKKFQCEYQLHR